jgi:DNA-binding MarR family transcriptional regulator
MDDDDVDLLINSWADILPDLDLSPLDVMSRLRRAAHELELIRQAAFRSAGLSPWEFDVLAALRRADPPHELAAAQLSTRTMIGTAAMSNRLKNLASRGLIDRQPHPSDGRSNLARLTPDGVSLVDRAMRDLVGREEEFLAHLSREQRAQLAASLRVLAAARD